jgi:molybdate transport system substrate-binding protein
MQMKLDKWIKSFVFIAALIGAGQARAGEVRVAVAANFTAAMKEIAAAFEKSSGHHVVLSFGSTGSLYAQISHGAPYDVFLAADERRPKALESAGTAVARSRFTYAVGKLVLWSPKPGVVDDKGEVLKHGKFARLAIANPRTAPYGAAARQVLEHLKLWDSLQPRIVRGESIAQTHQFVATDNAELGFVALSQVMKTGGGSSWIVPQALYTPIRQQAVLLVRGKDNTAAHALIAYLKSDAGAVVIKRFGYGTE